MIKFYCDQTISFFRSPTHVQFSNEQQGGSSRTSKLSGILGEIQRLRNKSGSTSGEA